MNLSNNDNNNNNNSNGAWMWRTIFHFEDIVQFSITEINEIETFVATSN